MNSGIYRIRNKRNGKTYIGQSIDLDSRWQMHIIRLRTRVHKSKTLQHDFNNWLREAMNAPTEFPFVFEVLMYCEKEKLEKTEMLFIAALQPEYNTQKFKQQRAELSPQFIKQMKEKYK